MRLAYQIMAQKTLHVSGAFISRDEYPAAKRIAPYQVEAMRTCPIIIADNVAEFLFDKAITAGFSAVNDIPCATPPFPMCFVEWKLPTVPEVEQSGETFGAFVAVGDGVEQIERDGMVLPAEIDKSRIRWVVVTSSWWSSKGTAVFSGFRVVHFLDNAGAFFGHSIFVGCDSCPGDAAVFYTPAFLAFSFMHCKNVERQEPASEMLPNDKWHRRMKVPKLKFYTLQVEPMKKVLRTEGGLEVNGLKKALHICRGHFATYTDDKPLFGRVTGTFWKPSHVRGALEHGAVVKDYAVSPASK